MTYRKRKFPPRTPHREYRRIYIISSEGAITEPQYFQLFQSESVTIHCLNSGRKSAPLYVLERIERYLKRNIKLRKNDEAWIIVDKDSWTDDQLGELRAWANQASNYHYAVSHPKFEYWLLLHFENGDGITSERDMLTRLNRHVPGYNKRIDRTKFTGERITMAVQRAARRTPPPDPHILFFYSDVFELVMRLGK